MNHFTLFKPVGQKPKHVLPEVHGRALTPSVYMNGRALTPSVYMNQHSIRTYKLALHVYICMSELFCIESYSCI